MVSEELLHKAALAYDFDMKTLFFISDSTNQVYGFMKNEQKYILRFSKRGSEQVEAEMDFISYLSKNNISVSLPLLSNGSLYVLICDSHGKQWIVTAFQFVSGKPCHTRDLSIWNEAMFYNWGMTMAEMHNLAKYYQPLNGVKRNVFSGRDALADSFKKCPSVYKITQNLITEMMELPKDKNAYGLIHFDFHPCNFFVDGNKINVFDFDDCLYGWFALDIGIALFHALFHEINWGRKENGFNDRIVTSFLKGYLSKNKLSEFWLSTIPMFMKFRQICRFSWFYNGDNENQKERISNIENGILFTEYTPQKELFLL